MKGFRRTLSYVLPLVLAASAHTFVVRAGGPHQRVGTAKPDEYGNICWKREKEILRNYAIVLKNAPKARGYIITYAGRRTSSWEVARNRGERAKSYLVKLGIPADRVVTIDGGFREELTWEVWVVPEGASPPEPTPTVEKSEVEITTEPEERPCSPPS